MHIGALQCVEYHCTAYHCTFLTRDPNSAYRCVLHRHCTFMYSKTTQTVHIAVLQCNALLCTCILYISIICTTMDPQQCCISTHCICSCTKMYPLKLHYHAPQETPKSAYCCKSTALSCHVGVYYSETRDPKQWIYR